MRFSLGFFNFVIGAMLLCLSIMRVKGKRNAVRAGREDFLDTSIKLEELPLEARGGLQGAGFTITFEKVRGKRPTPDKLNGQLIEDANGKLQWAQGQSVALSKDMEVLMEIYARRTNNAVRTRHIAQGFGTTHFGTGKKTARQGFIGKEGDSFSHPAVAHWPSVWEPINSRSEP